jgi:AcrR family transcriptional regulator
MGRSSAQAALKTRSSVLEAAAALASVEGLDSVTIGRLADVLGMSKSGVIGQFRNKEALQLEMVSLVFEDFRVRVWESVRRFPAGLPRLLAACEAWVEYAADPGYPGGCLLTQVTYDYDGRPGSVHERLVEGRQLWRDALRADMERGRESGDLPTDTDVETAIFGLESLAAFVTPARMLHGDGLAADRALAGMRRILGVPPPGSD